MDWASIIQGVANGALSGVSAYLNASAAKKASDKAYKRAKEFAQSGIQWKVADANAAGINPYFALGAPTATYSDSGVGVDPLGSALDAMGQNISRAALANSGGKGAAKLDSDMSALLLEKAGLENDYLRAKIASERATLTQPGGLHIPGSDVYMNVNDPNLGQTAENHYSDIGGNILGGMGLLNDVARMSPQGAAVLDTTKREIQGIVNWLNQTQRQGYLDLRPLFDRMGWSY